MQRYIGIDLGGTNIKGALVSETGKILKQRSVPTHAEAGAEAVTKTIAAMICALAEGESVSGVGMGCPGTVDDRRARWSMPAISGGYTTMCAPPCGS